MINGLKSLNKRLVSVLGPYAALLLLATLLAFTPLRLLSLLFVVFLFSQLFRFVTGIGLLTRVVLGSLAVVAITSIIALLSWVVNLPLSSALILVLLVITWKILSRSLVKAKPLTDNSQSIFDDLVSLGVAALVCVIFLVPFLQSPSAATLGQLVLFNGDNSTHVEIMKANDLNRGNAYGMDNRVNSFVDTASYPQGWHFFVAFSKWLSEPVINYQASPGKILLLFYLVGLAWYGSLIFLITRISIWLGRQLSKTKSRASVLGSLAIVLPITFGWIFTLFAYGFQTQIAALVFLLAEILLLSHCMAQSPSDRTTSLRYSMLFAASTAFMWIFLAPVAVLVVAACWLLTAWSLKKVSWKDILLIFFLGALVVTQFAFRWIFPLTFEATESFINSNGLVAKSDFSWLMLGALLVVYVWLIQRSKALLPAVLTLILGGLFSGGVLLYQYQTIGEARYFFFKANLTLIVMLTIVLGSLVVWLLASIIRKWPKDTMKARSLSLVAITLIIAGVVSFQVQTPLVEKYFNRTAFGVERQQADTILAIVGQDQSAGYRLIAIGSCDRANDIRATQLAWLSSFEPLPSSGLFEPMRMYIHDENILFDKISAHQQKTGNRPILLVNDKAVGQRFVARLQDQSANFEIVTIDNDSVDQAADQCPDRIRSF